MENGKKIISAIGARLSEFSNVFFSITLTLCGFAIFVAMLTQLMAPSVDGRMQLKLKCDTAGLEPVTVQCKPLTCDDRRCLLMCDSAFDFIAQTKVDIICYE